MVPESAVLVLSFGRPEPHLLLRRGGKFRIKLPIQRLCLYGQRRDQVSPKEGSVGEWFTC